VKLLLTIKTIAATTYDHKEVAMKTRMRRKGHLGCRMPFGLACTTVLLIVLALAGTCMAQSYRALLTWGDKDLGMENDANHLRQALLGQSGKTNWQDANITVAEAKTTVDDLATQVSEACKGNGEKDICLFLYAGHGWKIDDNLNDGDNGDDKNTNDKPVYGSDCKQKVKVNGPLDCDETIQPSHKTIRDDDLPKIFAGIQGIVVAIFDSCFSGGLDDGTLDLISNRKNQKIIFLAACNTNQTAIASVSWPTDGKDSKKHAHGIFSGGLIEGLADSEPGKAAPANADKNKTGEVTVAQLFEYAQDVMAKFDTDERKQRPAIQQGGGADPKTVLLKYTLGTTVLSPHRRVVTAERGEVDDIAFRCNCLNCSLEQFPKSVAQIGIATATGTETVTLTGVTGIQTDIGSLAAADGLDQAPAQIFEMELTGTSTLLGPITMRLPNPETPPFRFSSGQIRESANSRPGVLEIPPYTSTGTGEGSFDVFFDIETPEKRLHNESTMQIRATINQIPAAKGDTYTSRDLIALYDESGTPADVTITEFSLTPKR